MKQAVDYFVLLCASVLWEAAGEVGVTGGAPVFHVILLLSRKNRTNVSQDLKGPTDKALQNAGFYASLKEDIE